MRPAGGRGPAAGTTNNQIRVRDGELIQKPPTVVPELHHDAADATGMATLRSVAFDEELAARVRDRLRSVDGVSEKTMFGGRVFLVDGNIAVGVYGDDLLVRVDPDQVEDLVATDGVRPFMMGERATREFARHRRTAGRRRAGPVDRCCPR